MDCLCVRTCYLNHEGRNQQYAKGMVVEFKKCPSHFVCVSQAEVDLDSATEEFLLVSEVDAEDIKEYAAKHFQYKMAKNLKRETVIRKFVSIRDRYATPPTRFEE